MAEALEKVARRESMKGNANASKGKTVPPKTAGLFPADQSAGNGSKGKTVAPKSRRLFSDTNDRDRSNESAVRAAKTVGVGATSVKTFQQLKKKSPDLAQKVSNGEMNLNAAVNKVAAAARPKRAPDGGMFVSTLDPGMRWGGPA